MPYGTLNADTITNSNGLSGNAIGPGFKNRIINGDMRIDQRNAGAAVTVNSVNDTYSVDRFLGAGQSTDGVFTLQRSTTAPTGFTNSLVATVTTADASVGAAQYYFIAQKIEGFNVSDLGFGTANAKTVTLSFWVRSSVTGTFSGALANGAYNRSYPFTYTISSANTFEYKTVTIAGDTTGTWLTDNGIGLRIYWNLGTGVDNTGTAGAWTGAGNIGADSTVALISTLNATWYVTGVQLEVGPSATSFDYRPFGTELSLCQRYYEKSYNQSVVPGTASNDSGSQHEYNGATVTTGGGPIRFTITKRDAPTITSYSTNTGASGKVFIRSQGVDVTPSIDLIGQTGARMSYTQSSGIVNTTYHWVASSEL